MPRNNPRMPVPPANQPVYRIAVRGAVAGQSHLGYFYYGSADLTTPVGSAADLMLAFWTVVGQPMLNCLAPEWGVNSLVLRRVDFAGASSTVLSSAALAAAALNIVGQRTAVSSPQDSVVMRKRTYTVGQRGRGRWFFSGIPKADITNGVLSAGIAAWAALTSALTAGLTVTGTDLVPMHCEWREIPSDPPGGPSTNFLRGSQIIACDIDTIIRTQRRRQVGRGI